MDSETLISDLDTSKTLKIIVSDALGRDHGGDASKVRLVHSPNNKGKRRILQQVQFYSVTLESKSGSK